MAQNQQTIEVLKIILPLLEGRDLASCMCVSRQWRDVARDDYLWKCLCSKRWPSMCKRHSPPMATYHKLFRTFYHRRQPPRTLPPPRLYFSDLEFFIDLWSEDLLLFSEVIAGTTLQAGILDLPQGICDALKFHLESPEHKMTVQVMPQVTIALSQPVHVSVFVGRKDTNKMACIVGKSLFDYVDSTANRAHAFGYLDFAPICPFVSGIRAWISLLFVKAGSHQDLDVFGIEIDFRDTANSEAEVLWLLDMLDWK